jgi:hypothetical protein
MDNVDSTHADSQEVYNKGFPTPSNKKLFISRNTGVEPENLLIHQLMMAKCSASSSTDPSTPPLHKFLNPTHQISFLAHQVPPHHI